MILPTSPRTPFTLPVSVSVFPRLALAILCPGSPALLHSIFFPIPLSTRCAHTFFSPPSPSPALSPLLPLCRVIVPHGWSPRFPPPPSRLVRRPLPLLLPSHRVCPHLHPLLSPLRYLILPTLLFLLLETRQPTAFSCRPSHPLGAFSTSFVPPSWHYSLPLLVIASGVTIASVSSSLVSPHPACLRPNSASPLPIV
ncbi:hypothetical protein EDB92DRAFT_173181 [Lactarius akahatsu]|uniref:Uncharacterized protein n=1 Tax=Lactarius akahatsu TaxID=416441 RepID=A0AAD4Q8U0_9AGAM|nr:hypothetical protein EDB92DRAFT_173181 [Lactarius akahatsu]